ncbi:MAG: hypothetical protein KatS3mg105_3265 [Gemmatales bacterium]|nr:MAG: hypothetical protein KatS3mg105_3265 [Gemmatales bacterium]
MAPSVRKESCRHLHQTDSFVKRSSDEQSSIGSETSASDGRLVSGEAEQLAFGLQVPDAHGGIFAVLEFAVHDLATAAGEYAKGVGHETDAVDPVGMSFKTAQFLPAENIPYSGRIIGTA